MAKKTWCLVLFSTMIFVFNSFAQPPKTAAPAEIHWTFLDTKTIGAYDFIKAHPTYDGRGVIIIICDSGVDMRIPGLQKTSEGQVKVIDALDFSGQGDVELTEAVLDSSGGETYLKNETVRLSGFGQLKYQPKDSVFWIGCIDESNHFKNSHIKDINNNGSKTDKFGLITFPVKIENEERWVYYIDQDADGNLQDEKPMFDYKYRYDSFMLRGRDSDKKKALLTFAINIYPDDKLAVFHACDNSHGSHCAGISAGCRIYDRKQQHGIAPGAQVISAKIGNATLAGGCSTTGAMERAYKYGVEYAEKHNVPVVFSMSYGISSEIEGHSDIEKFFNKIMEENENVIVVVSNGNSGPGLSSAGNPSCASRILAAGALLPFESARDSYGFPVDGHRLFHFTSRCGEMNKPDCVTPGCAASTVPAWSTGENMWGTSMACPQLSGAAAVLISACLQEKIPFNGALIKRALKFSAKPLSGYTHLDQGTGIISIPAAFEIMKMYAKRKEAQKLLDYKISTESPIYPDGSGQTAYWRTGSYFPPSTKKQIFRVTPIFPKKLTGDEKQAFYRAFNLKADQSWLELDKKSTYIKADHAARIGVRFQDNLMKEPGLYVGKIVATPKSGPGKSIPEFELICSVIVPYEFNSTNDYQLKIRNRTLKSGLYHRYFVMVPPGASAMNVEISPVADKYCGIYGYVYNPAGFSVRRFRPMNPDSPRALRHKVKADDLVPGVWEIIPFAYFDLPRKSAYNLEVTFDGFLTQPQVIRKLKFKNGEQPKAFIRVTNQFREFEGKAQGELSGYQKTHKLKIKNSDMQHYHFKVNEKIESVLFKLEMTKKTFNNFTDVAVNILDKDKKILKASGFNGRKLSTRFTPSAPGEYILEIWAGFTHAEKAKKSWKLQLTEKYFTEETIDIELKKNDNSNFKLYQGLPAELDLILADSPRQAPDGFQNFGELNFIDSRSGRVVGVVPMLLKQAK